MVGRKGVDAARRELSWYLYEIRAALEIRFNDQQTASRVWASTTTNTFLLQILQRFFTFASTLIAFQLRPIYTLPQWHPNPRQLLPKPLTPLLPPRHLLRPPRARRPRRRLQRHLLLTVKRRSARRLARRHTLLTSTRVSCLSIFP